MRSIKSAWIDLIFVIILFCSVLFRGQVTFLVPALSIIEQVGNLAFPLPPHPSALFLIEGGHKGIKAQRDKGA